MGFPISLPHYTAMENSPLRHVKMCIVSRHKSVRNL
ncbi:hypothetical protein CORC01_12788 [Colletotrichum orchidophilum]|uniref:Uncharacterized protein n=1 Tax=Colletotrichum orchidophilum TaxID=1209926 RepID=A0A1G4ARZ7_9PEZI|nr:uncharacterized protein CORC01_12788 [Colletotrichum orchidophilum]OHE91938.1 hypothetical protein CORC01_12788 [Colletotrichum orchidophilum]